MPLYNYECPRCGEFREWQSMHRSEKPLQCPACGRLARRAVSAPRLGMDTARRRSHAINERSAHEPRVVHKQKGGPAARDAHCELARAHASHAGHRHAHGKLGQSNHPWMIRH